MEGFNKSHTAQHVMHAFAIETQAIQKYLWFAKVATKEGYQQIAEIIGRSLPSVKTDIHRARLEVRRRVKEYLQ